MKIKDLHANPDNPRKITDTKLEALKKALEEFGDLGGFVFNRTSKHLIGGHQRQKAFDASAQVVVEHKYKTPTRTGTVAEGFVLLKGERFKYREVAWDDMREKAATIAANRGAGEWDEEKLSDMFKELDMLGADLSLTMFDKFEIEDILNPPEKKTKKVEFEISSDSDVEYLIVIECTSEREQRTLFEELKERELKCKIL